MKKQALCILLSVSLASFAWEPEPNAAGFTLPDNQWVKIAENPSDPLGRELEPGYGSYLCFVPDSNFFIRYGGYSPTEGNELYTFRTLRREWKNDLPVDYSWPPPQNRPGAGPWWSMTYDSKRKCVWVFAGSGVARQTHSSLYNDIWKFEPATGAFAKMNSTNYPLGSNVRIAYDPVNDLVVRAPAYGGDWTNRHNQNATWVYIPDSNRWTSRSTPGSPTNQLAAGWLYCPPIAKFVYIGFNTTTTPHTVTTLTYEAAINKWDTLVTTGVPNARICPAIAYDPNTELIVMYGGIGHAGGSAYGYASRGGGIQQEDTWVLDPVEGIWTDISAIVGKPKLADLKKPDGTTLLPQKGSTTTDRGRLVFTQAAAYDTRNNVFIMSTPTCGVWALRYVPSGSAPLSSLDLPALPQLPPTSAPERIFPDFPLNQRLVNITPNKWLQLGGGKPIGGDEIPLKYDGNSGFFLKFGGCGNQGTTFASGYGNDLSAYDPFNERWIALRPTDPSGAPRPGNGCTRFYASDTANGSVWFAGGTSGNYLSSSIPLDWNSTSGIWRYVSKKDRFEMIPVPASHNAGAGVCCGFDPVNTIFAGMPCCYSSLNTAFNTTTLSYIAGRTKINPAGPTYTYADYVDSLGMIVVVDQIDAAGTTPKRSVLRGYNAGTNIWTIIADLPETTNVRPSVAYDSDKNVCLVNGIGGKTYIYKVGTGTWVNVTLDTVMPTLGEHVAYDKRHKVFIGGAKGGSAMWAFRYSDDSSTLSEADSRLGSRDFTILSVNPAPFRSTLEAKFALRNEAKVNVSVFSVAGMLVAKLTSGIKSGGIHSVSWNGKDAGNKNAAAGMYVLEFIVNGKRTFRPVMLLK